MRITQIRFKNLGSLVGEWQVDLAHPSIADEGIFAITGPTGAGKTTLLDAVCLALYGSTPRLGKISRNANEIMSRQTGECFAETTFETNAGRYRCHWSQHRARKKSDGELQTPKHEIADADSGAVLEASIRGVADRVEQVAGMDFERFTRSMLLAQGGFAAFLQASADERAPILEQITGSWIYSRISIAVHERRSEERKKLETLQTGLAGERLLTAEEERELGANLERMQREDQAFGIKIVAKNQALAWRARLAKLEDELAQIGRQKEDWRLRSQAFHPEREKLRLAVLALELAGDHAKLTSARREQESETLALETGRASVPAAEKEVGLAENERKRLVGQLEKNKAKRQEMLPILRKARELEVKIAEKRAPIEASEAALAEHQRSLEALDLKQNQDRAERQNGGKALEEVLHRLAAARADEQLVGHLTGIRGRIEVMQQLHDRVVLQRQEIDRADAGLKEAIRLDNERHTFLDAEKRALEEARNALDGQNGLYAATLAGLDASEWRNRVPALSKQCDLLQGAVDANGVVRTTERAMAETDRQKAILTDEKDGLGKKLVAAEEGRSRLEQDVRSLEIRLALIKRIEDLEQARHELEDGKPCPLCGSVDHPYALGNIPPADETRRDLDRLRAELKTVTGVIGDLKVRQARNDKDLERGEADRQMHTEKIDAARRTIAGVCAELSLEPIDPDPGAILEEELQKRRLALHQTVETVRAIDAAEKQLTLLRRKHDERKEAMAETVRAVGMSAQAKDFAAQSLERLKKEGDTLNQQHEAAVEALRRDLHPFAPAGWCVEDLAGIEKELVSRRDRWLALQSAKNGHERRLAELDTAIAQREVEIGKKQADRQRQHELGEQWRREREALRQERQKIFAGNDPDEEEARLGEAIEATDRALESARLKLDEANRKSGQLKARLEMLEKSIAARSSLLESLAADFCLRLERAGIADEAAYLAVCLPEDERNALMQQAQTLDDEKTALLAGEREKTRSLQDERARNLSDETVEILQAGLDTLLAGQKEVQQQAGALGQRLADNEKAKRRHREIIQALEVQREECARWDRLHELIGSADGKKFRNFAQGLTFEIMIGHANRQLQKMTDRYLLIRDDAAPLELNVIDAYQAGEIRTTKNLSGGESFLVSLALALGLSRMASRKTSVDSLFLDEGFGALDEEALETALETLAGLHQEGKLIGVISHVPALKERIGVQIRVEPTQGGRSFLFGPGCNKIAD